MLWGQENRFLETRITGAFYSEVAEMHGITFARPLELCLDPSILQLKEFLYYIWPTLMAQLFEK